VTNYLTLGLPLITWTLPKRRETKCFVRATGTIYEIFNWDAEFFAPCDRFVGLGLYFHAQILAIVFPRSLTWSRKWLCPCDSLCNTAKCYVYLSDIWARKRKAGDRLSEYTWELAFRASRLFTRGWALQELASGCFYFDNCTRSSPRSDRWVRTNRRMAAVIERQACKVAWWLDAQDDILNCRGTMTLLVLFLVHSTSPPLHTLPIPYHAMWSYLLQIRERRPA